MTKDNSDIYIKDLTPSAVAAAIINYQNKYKKLPIYLIAPPDLFLELFHLEWASFIAPKSLMDKGVGVLTSLKILGLSVIIQPELRTSEIVIHDDYVSGGKSKYDRLQKFYHVSGDSYVSTTLKNTIVIHGEYDSFLETLEPEKSDDKIYQASGGPPLDEEGGEVSSPKYTSKSESSSGFDLATFMAAISGD